MRTVVTLGDSTAYGMFDFEKGGWSNRLQARLMQEGVSDILDSTIVVNRALPGSNLTRILRETPDTIDYYTGFSKEVIAVAQVGLNEAKIFPPNDRPLISPERFGEQILAFCDLVVEHDAHPLLVGQAPIDTSRELPTISGAILDDETIAEYGEVMRTTADLAGYSYVDLRQAFVGYEPTQFLGPDGSHPNAFGHQVIADAVYDSLPRSFK